MNTNPLLKMNEFGQFIWLDCTRRDLIAGRELRRLIRKDGLRGMISNPSIRPHRKIIHTNINL